MTQSMNPDPSSLLNTFGGRRLKTDLLKSFIARFVFQGGSGQRGFFDQSGISSEQGQTLDGIPQRTGSAALLWLRSIQYVFSETRPPL
jgi:hypothetical protein